MQPSTGKLLQSNGNTKIMCKRQLKIEHTDQLHAKYEIFSVHQSKLKLKHVRIRRNLICQFIRTLVCSFIILD